MHVAFPGCFYNYIHRGELPSGSGPGLTREASSFEVHIHEITVPTDESAFTNTLSEKIKRSSMSRRATDQLEEEWLKTRWGLKLGYHQKYFTPTSLLRALLMDKYSTRNRERQSLIVCVISRLQSCFDLDGR